MTEKAKDRADEAFLRLALVRARESISLVPPQREQRIMECRRVEIGELRPVGKPLGEKVLGEEPACGRRADARRQPRNAQTANKRGSSSTPRSAPASCSS